MSDVRLLPQGILVGLSIAAPVGAIGLLCIQRTLRYGMLTGFVSGLGAATADVLYGMIAAFGVVYVEDFIETYRLFFQIIGGLFLIYMGFVIARESKPHSVSDSAQTSFIKSYFSTFFLTLANPLTIMAFVAIITAFDLQIQASQERIYFISGVLIGSIIWWFLLTGCMGLLRKRIAFTWFDYINKISGSAIALFGTYTFIKACFDYYRSK